MRFYRIGVDEVGRGSVYGPLCVGATCLIRQWHDDRVKDSKKVKPEVRALLEPLIMHNMLWAVASIDAATVDRYGMAVALRAAENRVVADVVAQVLRHNPQADIRVTFDGNEHDGKPIAICGARVETESVVRADSTFFEVSAASILAKVCHDRWITQKVFDNPELRKYRLLTNMGYGTQGHRIAIERYGLTPDHRPTFCQSLVKNHRFKVMQRENRRNATRTVTSKGQPAHAHGGRANRKVQV